ncbi:class II histocompatibility antigen, B-L beta chain-like [Zonotrichia albicollis]|uniref:class II histocompatibility antigen, B-L beta chain-like n=1 Tax=Zonotrichia albicollis TaxID=44394 RepID=UPI003D811DDC
MGRGAAAGALLVALVVLGAPPAAGAELSGVFQLMFKCECYFINGTEKVRFVERYIYNREQFVMFDSDVGLHVGFTPYGEGFAGKMNSDPARLEYARTAVDWYCRYNYHYYTPITVEHRVPPSVSISLVPPSSSQPGPGRLLCSVMDFYPAAIQVRWFQGQQELSEHVVATDVVPNGDWTYQLLVLLEIPPQRGLSYSCQVEHVSLEQPLRRHWEMPPDAASSKILMGIGGFVLGLVFLVLGLGFSLRKKVRAGAGGGVPAVAERVHSRRGPQPGVTPFSLPTELLSRRRPQPLPVGSGPAGPPAPSPLR